MLTLICLFGLEIHLAIPRRDLDKKSRMIGSAEAHQDSVSSAQHAFIEHLLCARDWTRLYPQCARMKTFFTDRLKLDTVWASSSMEEASSLLAALNQERIEGSTPSWVGRWHRETWGWHRETWLGQLEHARSLIWERGWASRGEWRPSCNLRVCFQTTRRLEEGPIPVSPSAVAPSAISGASVSAPASALQEEGHVPNQVHFHFLEKTI